MLDNENKLLDIPRGQITIYNQILITISGARVMARYFVDNFFKSRRRKDVVSSEVVEEVRERFKLKKYEMAELMGLNNSYYGMCLRRGVFLSFRFYGALDAIENAALNRAMRDVSSLHKLKSGLHLTDGDNLDGSNGEEK